MTRRLTLPDHALIRKDRVKKRASEELRRNFLSVLLFLLLTLCFMFPGRTTAQFSTPEITLETYGIVSSSGSTPFWLQSNRHGMFSGEGSQFMTRIQAHSTNNQLTNNLTLSYGADFIARPGTQSAAWFNQGYLRFDTWNLFLQAGRFHNTSPIHDEELGMGSLGVSGNATPIPQIRAGLSDWTSLPFTRDFIQIKGHLAHGWLGSERHVSDVLYHEKVGHARFGGDFIFNLYGGLAHYALWGGTDRDFGQLPVSAADYGRIFFVQGGDEETAPAVDALYMLGDHIGAWDFGFFLDLKNIDISAYRQFPLETKDNLKFKSPQDALTGVSIDFGDQQTFPLSKFVYEFMYTKWQDGPRVENVVNGTPCSELPEGFCRDPGQGNENYYNHSLYETGWAYNFRTIGNPLFTTRSDNRGIDNSRIVAHHIGLESRLGSVRFNGKFTFSRNYGTRAQPFENRRDQYSILSGIEMPLEINGNVVSLNIQIAYDNGSLVGDQLGGMVGMQLHL